ncbi:hypothetical protein VII00023_06227 [Vibrio ichthyoenteri ATCC 700023]|uniref:CENP-V/GFA domain-containing protein n=1 Tax=Vibrio ichthyoenteri ATCC 700023 TaxID=870968 RepID=F9RXI6_9VIBR|nr:GFA family protein [Vibrio ichthyoenteri]EGU47910.1 hypothetical protein VII00023_06227 [Vibrio ichthyoenteri ATCC 700023]
MTYPISAQCQCGQVSYRLKAAPQMVAACHCTECQKLATAPFSVTALVRAEDIDFYGEMGEWSRPAESGNVNSAKFCTGCGNRIYHFNPQAAELIKLKLKPVNLTDQSIFSPTLHLWVKQKQSWFTIPDGVEVCDTQP